MPLSDAIPRADAILALSMLGDFSMGQPIDQSLRTARLARLLALASHGKGDHVEVAGQVSLLRWSGCTANAEDFMLLLGDDVAGRSAMLSHTLNQEGARAVRRAAPLARVHCEVAGGIAETLELAPAVQVGLRNAFEEFDGQGRPFGLLHPDIPEVVYQVVLAGDLEILSRGHGVEAATGWIFSQRNRRYPAAIVDLFIPRAREWLELLDQPEEVSPLGVNDQEMVPLTLVGDVVDLKLPWLSGHSRKLATLMDEVTHLWGLQPEVAAQARKAALIHGIGRATVSNRIWNIPGPLSDGDFEQIRLVPYWTMRVTSRISSLVAPGQIAAHAYERPDGGGYFRGLSGGALNVEHRLLAAALAWLALRSERPWRRAWNSVEAGKLLRRSAEMGHFDVNCCEVVMTAVGERSEPFSPPKSLLTPREAEVLKSVSNGFSNKEAARQLGVSPSTVRTHMESVFRKLECTTRAAATLKAMTLGLI